MIHCLFYKGLFGTRLGIPFSGQRLVPSASIYHLAVFQAGAATNKVIHLGAKVSERAHTIPRVKEAKMIQLGRDSGKRRIGRKEK